MENTSPKDENDSWDRMVEVINENRDKIPMTLMENLNDLLTSRKNLSDELKEFIEVIRTQEIAVNSVKTVGAATTTIGAILLFTPLAPLGAGIVAGSSVGLVATSIGDFIADKVQEGNLNDFLEDDNKIANKFIEDMRKIDALAAEFVKSRIVKTMEEGRQSAFVFSLICIKVGLPALIGLAALYKPLKALFTDGIRFSGGKEALGVVSRTLGACVAALSILDCVLSWLTVNPNRQKAQDAKKLVDRSLNDLKELKDVFTKIQNAKKGA